MPTTKSYPNSNYYNCKRNHLTIAICFQYYLIQYNIHCMALDWLQSLNNRLVVYRQSPTLPTDHIRTFECTRYWNEWCSIIGYSNLFRSLFTITFSIEITFIDRRWTLCIDTLFLIEWQLTDWTLLLLKSDNNQTWNDDDDRIHSKQMIVKEVENDR